jgi:hypothetical protein
MVGSDRMFVVDAEDNRTFSIEYSPEDLAKTIGSGSITEEVRGRFLSPLR